MRDRLDALACLLIQIIVVAGLATSFVGLMILPPDEPPRQRLQASNPMEAPQKAAERPTATRSPTATYVWPTVTPATPTPIRYSNDEIDTLAAAIAYEALGESMDGRLAVGCVIMRRAILEGNLPSDVLTKEFFGEERGAEQVARMKLWWKPDNNDISMDDWQDITYLAINLANEWIPCPFEGRATHYFSTCLIDEPEWAKGMEFLGQIGCHRFYDRRLKHD